MDAMTGLNVTSLARLTYAASASPISRNAGACSTTLFANSNALNNSCCMIQYVALANRTVPRTCLSAPFDGALYTVPMVEKLVQHYSGQGKIILENNEDIAVNYLIEEFKDYDGEFPASGTRRRI
jgi:hypothetical protein